MTHKVTIDDNGPADTIKELQHTMSQREDADCVNDRVDVSVGVGVGTGVGVGVSGLGVSLGVSPGISLVVASPLLTFFDS